MLNIDRDDAMRAITAGVREAFIAALTSHGEFDLPHGLVCDAVRKGVADAFWKIATDAEKNPTGAFYEILKEGTSEALARFRTTAK